MTDAAFVKSIDFFPFNIPSGPEFLGVYTLIVALSLLLAKVVQRGVIGAMDGSEAPVPRDRGHLGGFRRPAQAGPRLLIGELPSPDDVHYVAFLRGGEGAVGDTIATLALGEGWLAPVPESEFIDVLPLPPEPCASSRKLFALLRGARTTRTALRAAIEEVAREEARRAEAALREGGFLVTGGAMAAGNAAFATVAAVPLVIAAHRLLRGVALGAPIGLLAVMMVATAIIALIAGMTSRVSLRGREYLAWLAGSTTALREDVRAGRSASPADASLAAALDGAEGIPALDRVWPAVARTDPGHSG